MAVVADIGQARDLVYGVLNTAWAGSPYTAVKIVYDDQAHKPDDNVPFLEASIVHGESGQATLGERNGIRYRSNARLIVDIKVPYNDGRALSDPMSQVIRAAFIGKRLSPDVVQFIRTQVVEMPRDGAYSKTRVVVAFNYDELF